MKTPPFPSHDRDLAWPWPLAAPPLAGCSMMPAYERPAAPIAAQWPDAMAPTSHEAGRPAADLAWQDFVGDTPCSELIRVALANNRDLRVAVLNMEQVRAAYQIRRADQFPTLDMAATGLRQPNTNGSGGITSAYTAGLAMASWEIDFFGRVRQPEGVGTRAVPGFRRGAPGGADRLIAAVANTWLSLQTDDELLALTQRTLATRDESLRLTKLRLDNGAASALDFRQAESLTAQARATLAQQRRLRALDVNALMLLLGQPLPGTLLATLGHCQPVFRDVPAGLPSDVLTRRPDMRQAEQQLIAANANIGAARAAFFPRISLTGSAGSASSELSGLFKNGS